MDLLWKVLKFELPLWAWLLIAALLVYIFNAEAFRQSYQRVLDARSETHHAKGFNATSLGVEFLVEGNHTYGTFAEAIRTPWLSDAQYETGIELVSGWVEDYSIETNNVLRHSDVSPGRKIDPGEGFPWDKFLSDLFDE